MDKFETLSSIIIKVIHCKNNDSNTFAVPSNRFCNWQTFQEGDFILGWFKLYSMLPKVFIFTSIVIFPISYVPQVNLNQKYWIKIEIYYGSKPIKVLYYELLRGKKDAQILLQKSMKE